MKTTYTLADLDPSIVVEPTTQATSAVIWLHGLAADGHDFVDVLPALALPEDHSVRFVFPHAPVQSVTVNGGMEMRSWYDIYSMTIAEKMDLEAIAMSSDVLQALIQEQVDQGVATERIVIAGFSQGGLIALNTALVVDYNLAGVMALSTYYPQGCVDALEKPVKSRPSVFMAHGEFDPVVPFAVAERSREHLVALDCQVDWHRFPMEHQLCMPEIEAISSWLKTRLAI